MKRKFITFTVLFAFIVLLVTSLVLYIIPGGSQAGPWSFWGFNRSQWIDLHLTSGLLMLLFSLWHLRLNWKSVVKSLKQTREFNFKSTGSVLAALALNIFIILGTLYNIQPVSLVMSTYRDFKQEMRRNAGQSVDLITNGRSREANWLKGHGQPDRPAENARLQAYPPR